jgi:hypothetical protein
MTNHDHNRAEMGCTPGRRILRINARFLPVLMGRGIHHYSVFKDAIPEDCYIIDAAVNFRGSHGIGELVLLLESEDWEPIEGVPVPEVKPSLVRHHCPRV